jgi:hypothetical protein
MMTKTLRLALATVLSTTVLVGVAAAGEPDPHGLAKLIAERLEAKRRTAALIQDTDIQGTDLGCSILPRRELRPFGYPGNGFFCEAGVSGEVIGGLLNRRGRQLCEIRGAYAGNACYDFDICGTPETLCVV